MVRLGNAHCFRDVTMERWLTVVNQRDLDDPLWHVVDYELRMAPELLMPQSS